MGSSYYCYCYFWCNCYDCYYTAVEEDDVEEEEEWCEGLADYFVLAESTWLPYRDLLLDSVKGA